MIKNKRGLGKGVEALLSGLSNNQNERAPIGYVNKNIVGSKDIKNKADILRIPANMIEPNPYQPRLSFNEEALNELASSIKTFGLIQPITVRQVSDTKYQIISGERRYKASRIAGLELIPAYIKDTDEQGMLEMAIVENIQRENLDPIEVAMSYQRLIDECNLTQEQMADRVSKKRATITNFLRLLKLPAKIQHDLKVGLLSVGHAKVLLGIDDAELQEQLCDLVVKNQLSVRQLEEKIKNLGKSNNKKENIILEYHQRLINDIKNITGSKVSIKRDASGKGSITIKFQSDSQVEKLLSALELKNNEN